MEVALLPARRITKRPAQQVCPKSLMEQKCIQFFLFFLWSFTFRRFRVLLSYMLAKLPDTSDLAGYVLQLYFQLQSG